jgi:carbonic anhydrase
MDYQDLIHELINIVIDEHVADCDDDDCLINKAYDQELIILSIFLFSQANNNQEFQTIYQKLPSRFSKEVTKEKLLLLP